MTIDDTWHGCYNASIINQPIEDCKKMVTQYDNTNSGILARNTRKEKESHPDYTGSLNVAGTDYWLSAWVNEGRPGSKMEGRKYFSIKINPKDAPQSSTSRSYAENGFADEDIPF